MKRLATLATAVACLGLISQSGALGAPEGARGRQVSWWSSARAVPVAAYANDVRLNQDALALKGLGRTVLPMRSLFRSLGATVDWDATQRAVTAWKADGTGVRFVVGERQMELLNRPEEANQSSSVVGETRTLDAPAMLVANRVYVPVRAAVEALGAGVRWAGDEPAIYLSVQGEPVVGTPPTTDQESFRNLQASLTLPRTRFRAGAAIPMELTLTNNGVVPVALTFPTGQQFDFQVFRDNRIVWSWAGDRAFTQAFTTRTLAPGERLRFTTRWRQLSSLGGYVTPGTYTVRGIVTTTPRSEVLMAEREIQIR